MGGRSRTTVFFWPSRYAAISRSAVAFGVRYVELFFRTSPRLPWNEDHTDEDHGKVT